jgi:hypothetical protein
MKFIIDRFEGNFALCEDEQGNMINIERHKVPMEAIEGDVLVIKENNIVIDRQETERRKSHIKGLMTELFK